MTSTNADPTVAAATETGATPAAVRAGSSQRWRLAWEKAYAQNRVPGSTVAPDAPRDPPAAGAARRDSSGVPAIEYAASRATTPTAAPPTHGAAAALDTPRTAAAPRGAAEPTDPRLLPTAASPPLRRPGSSAGTGALSRSEQATAQGGAPARATEPRSVRLLAAHGLVTVVIRDLGLDKASLPKLAARVRELVAGLGVRVAAVVVNGSVVWAEPMSQASAAQDETLEGSL
jgi:hypothetical protein